MNFEQYQDGEAVEGEGEATAAEGETTGEQTADGGGGENESEGITAWGSEQVGNAFALLEQEFGDEATGMLRREWGAGAGDRLAEIAAWQKDNPELAAVAERFGMLDDPGTLALASRLARAAGYAVGTTKGQRARIAEMGKEPKTMSDDELTAFEDRLQEIQDEIDKAQARGLSKRANRLYQKKMAAIAERDGDQPIVGSVGRYA